jgi:hypothetical protein
MTLYDLVGQLDYQSLVELEHVVRRELDQRRRFETPIDVDFQEQPAVSRTPQRRGARRPLGTDRVRDHNAARERLENGGSQRDAFDRWLVTRGQAQRLR